MSTNVCDENIFLNVQLSDFEVYLREEMSLGYLIVAINRPLFQVSYEVILLYPSSIGDNKIFKHQTLNLSIQVFCLNCLKRALLPIENVLPL